MVKPRALVLAVAGNKIRERGAGKKADDACHSHKDAGKAVKARKDGKNRAAYKAKNHRVRVVGELFQKPGDKLGAAKDSRKDSDSVWKQKEKGVDASFGIKQGRNACYDDWIYAHNQHKERA